MAGWLVAEYTAAGGISAIITAGYELWQFARTNDRMPWRGGKDRGRTKNQYPTWKFWLGINIALRAVLAGAAAGVQAWAGWIVNVGAALIIGASTTFTLSSVAGAKDVGQVPGADEKPSTDSSNASAVPKMEA